MGSRTTRRSALLWSSALIVVAVPIGAATAGSTEEPAASEERASSAVVQRVRTGKVRGRHLRVRKLTKAPRGPKGEREEEETVRAPVTNPPNELVDPPSGPPLPPDGPVARAASEVTTSILRNTAIVKGGNRTSIVGEPTAVNDENAILATGNHFEAISESNGLVDGTWGRFLNRDELFPSSLPGGDFCCDQVTATADRGRHQLTFLAAKGQEANDTNSINIVMFDGRDDQLRDDSVALADVCSFDFQAEDFGLDDERELDYIQMATSTNFLYVTSDVKKIRENDDTPPYDGTVAWRMALDDWEQECRDAPASDGELEFSSFFENGGNNALTPVSGATTTMFLARHRDSVTTTDRLRIWQWPDVGAPLFVDKDIDNWPGLAGTFKCKMDNVNSDPCRRLDGRLRPGYISGSTVGWAWTSSQGKGFKFPHVRAVAFSTPSLTKQMDKQIYSDDFAVTYPAVGVSPAGRLGVVYYKMGGSVEPEARVFITDTPRDWDVNATTIVASTHAPQAEGNGDSKWGDYSSVGRYNGCPGTFLAAVHSLQGGNDDNDVEVRSVWFGEPETGCPDYDVSDLDVVRNFSGEASAGDSFIVGVRTRNSGVTTPALDSRTAVYLSHDLEVSDGDIRFEPTDLVTPLRAGTEHFFNTQYAIPGNAAGTYNVIACADDRTRIDNEVSETNNCRVAVDGNGNPDTIEVAGRLFDSAIRDVSVAGSRAIVTMNGTGTTSKQMRRFPLDVQAAPTDNFRLPGIELGVGSTTFSAASGAGASTITQRRTIALKLPKRVRRGRYFVRVCVRTGQRGGDARFDNDCKTTRRAVTLRR
jgi:hypothetical protein